MPKKIEINCERLEESNSGYYLEPANSNVDAIEFEIQVPLLIFGKLRSTLDWPNNADFIDDNPPKGKVFSYYYYEELP